MNNLLVMLGVIGVVFCGSVNDPMARHMTHEEQDRTGVSRLYSGHKEELAQWMDKKGNDSNPKNFLTLSEVLPQASSENQEIWAERISYLNSRQIRMVSREEYFSKCKELYMENKWGFCFDCTE